MGAFTDGGQRQEPITQKEEEPEETKDVEVDTKDTEAEVEADTKKEEPKEPEGFPTDVKDLMADDEHPIGNTRFPVFNVSKQEFYQNMSHGRKRLRFKTGGKAQQYMKGTKYQRPFFIAFTDSKGKTYSRKIK